MFLAVDFICDFSFLLILGAEGRGGGKESLFQGGSSNPNLPPEGGSVSSLMAAHFGTSRQEEDLPALVERGQRDFVPRTNTYRPLVVQTTNLRVQLLEVIRALNMPIHNVDINNNILP